MGIPCVDHLGSQLEGSWRTLGYSPDTFRELAVRLLREADLPAQIRPDDIVKWCLRAPCLPLQADPLSKFGQPAVTLFRSSRFYIDALFWLDGTTTIHQHAFSGAFQVLAGSSIETLFSFEAERAFDGHFVLGSLQVRSSTLIHQGDVRPIESGSSLIHSLFHLERPSVSIVVRTGADPGVAPQFNYLRAGIGRNPFLVDETVDRKLQVVSMLKTVRHPAFEDIVGDLIAGADLHTAFRIIRQCASHGAIDRLIDQVRDPRAADRFRVALKDQRREKFLIGRRGVVAEPDLRFFLGVLLNASRRRDVLILTSQKDAKLDPARQVASWLRQLSMVTVKLQADGSPWEPNLLGLPEFDDDLEHACVGALKGEDRVLDGRTSSALSRLRSLPALSCLFDDSIPAVGGT